MGSRRIVHWEEQDVYTPWRHLLVWTSRPGAVRKVKKRTHRRERREGASEASKQYRDFLCERDGEMGPGSSLS